MQSRLLLIFIVSVWVFSCKGPDARKPVQKHSGTFIKESAERNKDLYDSEKKFIEQVISKDSTNTYYASENGFWYFYNHRDTTTTNKPEVGDIVEFTYDIKDFYGNTVISREENGMQHYKIDQSNQELISGIREGIKLMNEGETVTFLLPSYKAYGYYGIADRLGTNIPVQSTVTLHKVQHVKTKQP